MRMSWSKIAEHELLDDINEAYLRMSPSLRAFWEQIAIYPEKWKQHSCGNREDGFWVVAVMGRRIIWYNLLKMDGILQPTAGTTVSPTTGVIKTNLSGRLKNSGPIRHEARLRDRYLYEKDGEQTARAIVGAASPLAHH
jgi:hypothetical protein